MHTSLIAHTSSIEHGVIVGLGVMAVVVYGAGWCRGEFHPDGQRHRGSRAWGRLPAAERQHTVARLAELAK